MSETLYVNMDKSVEVTNVDVTISDIAKLWCRDQSVVNKVKTLKVLKEKGEINQRYIVTIMKVIQMIETEIPGVEINNIGETDCVIEIKRGKKTNNALQILKVVIVCFILFFGAGFSIMSFNNDVGVSQLFEDIVKSVSDNVETGKKVLELSYAIGILVGITVFYNHFGAKKLSNDPTPIEVEMRDYEDSIYDALVEGHNRDDGRLDVK